MREIVQRIPYSAIYITAKSQAPIALVDPQTGDIALAVHSGYVSFRVEHADKLEGFTICGSQTGRWQSIFLPENSIRRSGDSNRRGRDGVKDDACETCHLALPASERCDNCD